MLAQHKKLAVVCLTAGFLMIWGGSRYYSAQATFSDPTLDHPDILHEFPQEGWKSTVLAWPEGRMSIGISYDYDTRKGIEA